MNDLAWFYAAHVVIPYFYFSVSHFRWVQIQITNYILLSMLINEDKSFENMDNYKPLCIYVIQFKKNDDTFDYKIDVGSFPEHSICFQVWIRHDAQYEW